MSKLNPKESQLIAVSWRDLVKPYQTPDNWRSIWQIANTLIPYFALWYAMYLSLSVSYALTLALSVVQAGFMIRTFIIMHDCGHGSFFKSQRANHIVGTICGILTNAPYHQWTREHAIHHATSGDLNRRGTGDVNTLTVKEYLALSKLGKLKYRLYRNPLITFGIGPHYIFLFWSRFVGPHSGARERNNVYLTNVALYSLWGAAIWAVGLQAFLLIWAPVIILGGGLGVWLFYVQHQYENTYWRRGKDWDYATAALQGSSYFSMPRLMHWLTGNIGFHHIHHLCPKIPNYKLRACHEANPLFQQSPMITWASSFKCASLKLWDEDQQRLVGFKHLKTLPAADAQPEFASGD
jgi:omega-6 fatty acid desaturase (delta-12 desaturase)